MRATSPVTTGRRAELAVIDEALGRLRTRRGGSVFVLGEAGIGKSRLARESVDRAARLGVCVLRGRGSATGLTGPFRPLVEALASYSRADGLPADPELEPYRPALARVVPEWRRAAAGPENLVELAEALLRLLAVLGRGRGCLLVLEDLHEADHETLAVVDYLVDNLATLPVLIVGTLRPEPVAVLELVDAAVRRRTAAALTLRPLDAPGIRAVAAGCLEVAADRVPAVVVDRLTTYGGGNPYLAEELLSDMVGSGAVRVAPTGVTVVGDPATGVPASVVQSHAQRLARLDPAVGRLLLTAACLGPRFSAATLHLALGAGEQELFACLGAATRAGFVTPVGDGTDRYAFRYRLTAEALLAVPTPPERAALARRTATALENAGPLPTEDRCRLVADLWTTAGERGRAAAGYAEAGRRAQARGACESAVALFERAAELAPVEDRASVVESLAQALAGAGRLERAFALAETLDMVGSETPDVGRRVDLHLRLARDAALAERGADARGQLAAARALAPELGRVPKAAPSARRTGQAGQAGRTGQAGQAGQAGRTGQAGRAGQAGLTAHGPGGAAAGMSGADAALAVVEGHLALLPGPVGRGGPDRPTRLAEAERSARRAVEAAERASLPVVECQALHLLALLGRERGPGRADACLERMLGVAEKHGLPLWRAEALVGLGVNALTRTGSPARLEAARQTARELGAIAPAQDSEGTLALHAVLRAEYDQARETVDRSLAATARLRDSTRRRLLLASATLAAHRGRRGEMERELERFHRADGADSLLTPVVLGLCRAFCALMEEDRPAAVRELAAVAAREATHPDVLHLSGSHGLGPLLDVLAGRAGRTALREHGAAPAAEFAWNHQFLLMAEAVLLGREGRDGEAVAVLATVRAAYGTLFPAAHHLGLRLVAEAAQEDGWGDPVEWLRAAEEYFHAADVTAVAGACRALLRRSGAGVRQRRVGRDRVPAAVRQLGVTPREYDVLALLAERLSNPEIARRLSISPRTVEKHIAGLARKTGRSERSALRALACLQTALT
ncbi:AAA family ATPase [Streptomyces sp. NPDC060184]|uniref:helix-turn-helix transcriptional regulator n=1 Tax=Streptomyces sp. NPDC060184 TaxID=3347064 RepID=UPI0036621C8E